RPGSGEGRARTLLQHTVYIEVDFFVVEAEQVLDLWNLGNRPRIPPDEIAIFLVAHAQGPVACRTLVWAVRHGIRRFEKIHAHVQLRDVVARRQTRLVEQHGTRGLGDQLSIDLDPHATGAVDGVDPRVRI